MHVKSRLGQLIYERHSDPRQLYAAMAASPAKFPDGFLADAGAGLERAGICVGRGATRAVFADKHNSDAVVKIEGLGDVHASVFIAHGRFRRSRGPANNANEAAVWKAVKDDPDLARWFAPVLGISDAGWVLVQAKAGPLAKKPAEIPYFINDWNSDSKIGNWGTYAGHPVLVDYGQTYLRDVLNPEWHHLVPNTAF